MIQIVRQRSAQLIVNALIAAVIFWLGQHGYAWLALAIVAVEHGRGLWSGRQLQLSNWLAVMPSWLVGSSIVLLITLNPKLVAQVGWALLYWLWDSWVDDMARGRVGRLSMAAISQFTGITAILLATAVWHWPTYLVMTGSWLVSFVAASFWLEEETTRAKAALAAAWALIAAECVWVFSIWLVNYILLGGIIIVPQAAVVLTALGYCFGSITLAQGAGRLSRMRLLEYLAIGLVTVLVVIAGTNWKGTI